MENGIAQVSVPYPVVAVAPVVSRTRRVTSRGKREEVKRNNRDVVHGRRERRLYTRETRRRRREGREEEEKKKKKRRDPANGADDDDATAELFVYSGAHSRTATACTLPPYKTCAHSISRGTGAARDATLRAAEEVRGIPGDRARAVAGAFSQFSLRFVPESASAR